MRQFIAANALYIRSIVAAYGQLFGWPMSAFPLPSFSESLIFSTTVISDN